MRQLVFGLILLIAVTTSAWGGTFGEGVTLPDMTSISTILDRPEEFAGKRVKVTGLVVDVCERRGCWMYIAGDRPFEKIRVKVTDGDIVFPLEARGKTAEVEGVVEVFELTREEVVAQRRHHADEQGIPFDPATVTTGEKVVRLRGLGAEIPGL